jgi:3-hydroxyisobutyrate dehydrogenase-like beta-hydroxyacid dehydrogenase
MMSDQIAVIGLGNMGIRLAASLRGNGHKVVGWTRSAARRQSTRTLVDVADSLPEALDGCSLAILCVPDLSASAQVLENAEAARLLNGKVIVQLTSESPDEAREFSTRASALGISVLDGAIATLPAGIGRKEAVIYYSGPETAFHTHQAALLALTGKPVYCGEDAGAASAMDMAWLALFFPASLGFIQGIALCQAYGLDPDLFLEAAPSYFLELGDLVSDLRRQIPSGVFSGDQATLAVHLPAAEQVARVSRLMGLDDRLPRAATDLIRIAADAGHGQMEFAAITESMRKASSDKA